ncbi:MAG: cation transporter [Actinobacteria bacterium]|nr:cation transporter [Actinomycetota bacterium]
MMKQMESASHIEGADRIHAIKQVLWGILFLNIAVAVAKYGYGVFTDTTSMQADGIHSLFDSAGNVVGLIGMAIASRPADSDHPYGHAKFETYASAIIGMLLLFAAYRVSSEAVTNLRFGTGTPDITYISFIVMIATLVVNIIVTTWERRESKRLGSEVLAADSRHTLSDVLVSIGVMIGLVFIKLGYTIMDPIMSLVVALFILKAAYEVFKTAIVTLSDTARIPIADVKSCVALVPGTAGCHGVRTRGTETEVYVDLHLLVDSDISVREAHAVAEQVEHCIKEKLPQVRDVVVHIEPDDEHQKKISELEQK